MKFFKWLSSGPVGGKNIVDTGPDPDDITVENAYKTRWVWYHTILALEILTTNILLASILVVLAIKL